MTNQSEAELCRIAEDAVNTRGFSSILVMEILLGTVAIWANTTVLCSIWKVKIFHSNLRVLLFHFNFTLLWYSVNYSVKAALLLPMTMERGNPCDLNTPMASCKIREIPFSIPAQIAVYGQLAISVERVWSTLMYKRYADLVNKHDQWPIVSIVLIPACYLIPLGNILNSVTSIPKSEIVTICENLLSMASKSAASGLTLNTIVLFLTAVCVIVVYYYNRYKLRNILINKANHTLSERFQIDQNIQINRFIIPDLMLQLCCFIPNYIFLFLIVFGFPITYDTKIILVHVNYVWKLIYAIAHPSVVVYRNIHVRRRVKQLLPSSLLRVFRWDKEKRPIVATVEHDTKFQTEKHFTILQEAWASTNAPRSDR